MSNDCATQVSDEDPPEDYFQALADLHYWANLGLKTGDLRHFHTALVFSRIARDRLSRLMENDPATITPTRVDALIERRQWEDIATRGLEHVRRGRALLTLLVETEKPVDYQALLRRFLANVYEEDPFAARLAIENPSFHAYSDAEKRVLEGLFQEINRERPA